MKRLLYAFLSILPLHLYAEGIMTGIGETNFTFPLSDIFPSPNKAPSDKGIGNVVDYIIYIIPSVTTLMAVGAVVMIIFGGLHMVLGGADSEQNEKGKSIIKDAIMGLLFGLLAYVIITLLGNILDI